MAFGQVQPSVSFSRNAGTNTLFWWGDPWTDYIVESSTNLINWQEDGLMDGTLNEKGTYTYLTSGSENQKFYRVKFSRFVPYVASVIDSTSPQQGTVQISSAAPTANVVLAVYDIKCVNGSGTMRSFPITITTTGVNVTNLFSDFKIDVGGVTYSATSIGWDGDNGTNATVIFTNLTVPLPAETYVPVRISANIVQANGNSLDGTTVVTKMSAWGTPEQHNEYVKNPDVEDIDGNAVAFQETYVHSSVLTFVNGSDIIPSAFIVSSGSVVANQGGQSVQSFSFTFSLTAGNQPAYVSKTMTNALLTEVIGSIGAVVPINFHDNDNVGDTPNYFYIPPGATKTFTASYQASGYPGTVSGTFRIDSIRYGMSSTNLAGYSVSGQMDPGWFEAVLSF